MVNLFNFYSSGNSAYLLELDYLDCLGFASGNLLLASQCSPALGAPVLDSLHLVVPHLDLLPNTSKHFRGYGYGGS